MDSTKNSSGTEGCSSSESGWTMYIASPMQEDDDMGSDVDNDYNDQNVISNNGNAAADDDEASDDSMASDASSGPHHPYKRENSHASNRAASFKHDKDDKFSHFSAATKPNKIEKKSDATLLKGT